MNYLWLALLIALAATEAATMGLTTIWFAGGSLVAFIASVLGAPLWLQGTLFLSTSVLLLIFTRPIAVRYVNSRTIKTNIDALTGKTAKVIETIDNINGTGHVFIKGLEWTARTETEGVVIEAGELVTVLRIEGVKLIVKKKEEVA